MPPLGGILKMAPAMHQSESEIAQSGHDLRSVAGAETRTIFTKGDITHVMRRIFEAPVPASQVEQASGRSKAGREGGDEGDDVLSDLDGHGAGHVGERAWFRSILTVMERTSTRPRWESVVESCSKEA
jgi:hypothetical protein